MERLLYEFVKNGFEGEGFILLTTVYKNAHQELNYICPHGHQHHISWNNWKKGIRCPHCSKKIKKTIEFIRTEFKKEGYILLSNSYKNSHQKLKYICPNNHKHSISWAKWQSGRRCFYCHGKVKYTIGFIKSEFEKENYILLTTVYINSKQRLEYICPNGHRHSILWCEWCQGHRCGVCWDTIYRFGKTSPNWKGGVSCNPYCDVWADKEYKDSIKERDNYKCQNPDCWRTSMRLTIHHIDYDKKNCKPQNLITLCNSCNVRANKDRCWHENWYQAIIYKRYLGS